MITITPSRLPIATGENEIDNVQDAPGATLVPQVFVCTASPFATTVRFKVFVCLFVSVTIAGGLVVPTDWLPKVRLVAESVTGTGS